MSAFDQAFDNSMGHEKGYTSSGPTYRGIDHRFHPSWPGWPEVSRWKGGEITEDELVQQTDELVRRFYMVEFWEKMRGDAVAAIDIPLSTAIFDFSVHSGVTDAVRALQRALNKMNRNGASYPDLKPDGKLGNETLNTLRRCLQLTIGGSKENSRVNLFVHFFGERYDHMVECGDFESWPGWFLRLAKEVARVLG